MGKGCTVCAHYDDDRMHKRLVSIATAAHTTHHVTPCIGRQCRAAGLEHTLGVAVPMYATTAMVDGKRAPMPFKLGNSGTSPGRQRRHWRQSSTSRAATAWRGGGGGRGGVDGEGRGHAWPLATSTGPRRAAPHHPCGLVAGGLPTAGLRHACYTRPYASSACVLPQHSPLPRTVLAHNKNGHAKQPFPMTPGPSDQWAPCKAPTDQWAPLQGARRPGCPARRPLAQSRGCGLCGARDACYGQAY